MGAESISIGPCDVTYDGVNLGLTKGGVSLEVSTEVYDTMADQFGDTPVFSTVSKRTVTVTVPLLETTLDNLVLTMPGAELVVDGTDPTKRMVKIFSSIGLDLLAVAKPLILHPRSEGTSKAKDVVIPLAGTGGGVSFAYESNQERIFNVEFTGYVNTDNTDANNGIIMTFGDPESGARSFDSYFFKFSSEQVNFDMENV